MPDNKLQCAIVELKQANNQLILPFGLTSTPFTLTSPYQFLYPGILDLGEQFKD